VPFVADLQGCQYSRFRGCEPLILSTVSLTPQHARPDMKLMKNLFAPFVLAATLGGLLISAQLAPAQGTAFTYQGQLQNSGSPANGNYDFTFALFNINAGGPSQVGGTLTNLDVGVTNGLFTVTLDFGPVFTGHATSLAIGVRTNGGASFTGLSPLQELTPTPYAIYSPNAGAAASANSVAGSNIVGAIMVTNLPSAVITNGASGITLSGAFTGNGGGLSNVPGTLAQMVASSTNFMAQANTAYDLTNSVEVSVSLPTNANVGDLVQVTGNGAGGWQVTLGSVVYWTKQTGAPTSADWSSVASSSDGSHLVAVEGPGGIYTSTNSGVTWSEQTNAPTSAGWVSVASSSDGSHLVAAEYPGGIYTSTNSGVTWTEQTSAPTSADWFSVASSSDGSHLVAVVNGGGIYTSANSGVTWTEQTSAPSTNWVSVASSSDGTHLVAVEQFGGIYTSTNSGVAWTEETGAPTSADWFSVASSSDGSHLVAVVNGGGIYTSANSGVTWTEQTSAPTSAGWQSVASSSDGTHLVAVVEYGGIYTSANSGVTWTEQTVAPTSANWISVTTSSDGTHLTAIVQYGGIYTSTTTVSGAAGTSDQFQYLGNGLWQPLPPTAGYLSNNGSTVQSLSNLVINGESGVTLSGTFSGNGGGLTNLNAAQLTGFSQTTPPANGYPILNMVWIVPGTFIMGAPTSDPDYHSDEAQHVVSLTNGFWMGQHPVTQGEYLAVIGSNPSFFTGDLSRPVEQVSWFNATNFCNTLTQNEQSAGRLPAAWVYRLPTEAEWEYCCRALTTSRYYFGNDPGDGTSLTNYAWYSANSGNTTKPVGQLLPNAWGLVDMAGNVFEWCQDWYGTYPTANVSYNPPGPATGSYRVLRGGGWDDPAVFCRSAGRISDYPTSVDYDYGFRVVLAPGQ
jgi:formylglycine-generating enzyme required for sulfatase activity/photosystem II stability/assembly factor-like uncharacterized protein